MKVTLNRINDDYLFEAIGANDVPVLIDNKTNDVVKGASPMELVLMAVGGCNAIDIISILKKQRQEVTSYSIDVEGTRKEVKQARPFDSIHLTVHLNGTVDPEKAKKAAALSFEKYCSVSLTLTGCVHITYSIIVNGETI
ncbi:putative redox protein [Ulvibacter sp. MAR_2010_11]|uniref:OsmC family protein n=1 Tax=Ulvibacter sp. MAR_2010_11 TaxID=1250229 RepID=UPI000C2CD668|nr:OsmC family protein [Ulvibacter sp. MAR_2010_11]PKA82403.1 putative redox protein [Ulvibacter sp. MAR_2010_11]